MSIIALFVGALIALLTSTYLYLKRRNEFFRNEGILQSDNPTIFVGDMRSCGIKIHVVERIHELYSKFQGRDILFGMYLMLRPSIVPTDLDLIRQIFIKDFSYFRDRGMYVNEKHDPMSAHLFSLDGERWTEMRKKLSPTFTSGRIKQMFEIISKFSVEFDGIFEKFSETGEVMDVKNSCVWFLADIIGLAAFGLECNAMKNPNSELIAKSKLLFQPTFKEFWRQIIAVGCPDLALKFGMRLLPYELTSYFMKVLKETVAFRESRNEERNDFLNILIKIKNLGRAGDEATSEYLGKITFDELAAQAFVFFFAGFETSSATMSFTIYELANNMDIQENVRKEILDVMEKHDGILTYEAVNELHYLEQVVNEILRLYTPVPLLIRQTVHDYNVPNSQHTLKKGQFIVIPAYGIHHDENIYPDPFKFDPDRFTPKNVKSRHPCAFIPFGDGPRNCIGNRFGMLQVKMGLATIFKRYKITMDERCKYPIEIDPVSPMISNKTGIWIRVQKI